MIIYILGFEHVHYVIAIADHLLGVIVQWSYNSTQNSFIIIYILSFKHVYYVQTIADQILGFTFLCSYKSTIYIYNYLYFR